MKRDIPADSSTIRDKKQTRLEGSGVTNWRGPAATSVIGNNYFHSVKPNVWSTVIANRESIRLVALKIVTNL